MTRTATLFAILASVSLSAQTTPATTHSVSVTGCVAEVQRDGSTGAKSAGTQATPETAAMEANNLAAKMPSRTAATADGTRTLQVMSVKMIGMDCTGPKPPQ